MKISGQHIVVVDNGFVFHGECVTQGRLLVIDCAKNIRIWGTVHGLGEIINGPTSKTVLDDWKTVVVPVSRIVFVLPSGWKK